MSEEEKAKIQELLTFVVVGGGPTGVELCGELTDFLYNEGARLYGHLKSFIRVHMFTYDLLNTFDQELQDYAISHLRKKQNVQVHLGAFVQKVEPHVVHVKLGESSMSIRYGTLVWCAGIKPHPFVKSFGFAMNERGSQVLVDRFLKVKGEDDIFAIGDCSTIEDYWLPQTAQVANQEGQYLAKCLSNKDSSNIKPFEFHNKARTQKHGLMMFQSINAFFVLNSDSTPGHDGLLGRIQCCHGQSARSQPHHWLHCISGLAFHLLVFAALHEKSLHVVHRLVSMLVCIQAFACISKCISSLLTLGHCTLRNTSLRTRSHTFRTQIATNIIHCLIDRLHISLLFQNESTSI